MRDGRIFSPPFVGVIYLAMPIRYFRIWPLLLRVHNVARILSPRRWKKKAVDFIEVLTFVGEVLFTGCLQRILANYCQEAFFYRDCYECGSLDDLKSSGIYSVDLKSAKECYLVRFDSCGESFVSGVFTLKYTRLILYVSAVWILFCPVACCQEWHQCDHKSECSNFLR